MRTGRCLCGEVTYELAGDLIATAVCHCDHCQRQSGGAFSVNLIAHESQFSVNGELRTYEETGENNDAVYGERRTRYLQQDRQRLNDRRSRSVAADERRRYHAHRSDACRFRCRFQRHDGTDPDG